MPGNLAARLLREVRNDAPHAVPLLDDSDMDERDGPRQVPAARQPRRSPSGNRARPSPRPPPRAAPGARRASSPHPSRAGRPEPCRRAVGSPNCAETMTMFRRRARRQRRDPERVVEHAGVQPPRRDSRSDAKLVVEQPGPQRRERRERQRPEVDRLATRRLVLRLARWQKEKRSPAAHAASTPLRPSLLGRPMFPLCRIQRRDAARSARPERTSSNPPEALRPLLR